MAKPRRRYHSRPVARQQRQQTQPAGAGAADSAIAVGRASTRGSTSRQIDYKDINLLRRFISDRGKTRSRRVTGLSRRHQQQLALAVKRARELALLPYVGER